MRLASGERLWGSLWYERAETVKRTPVSIEAGLPLTLQSINSVRREIRGLLLGALHHLAEDRNQWRALVNTVLILNSKGLSSIELVDDKWRRLRIVKLGTDMCSLLLL
jgi:hypothetical protein